MSEIGTGYTEGDYLNSDIYGGSVPTHDNPVADETSGNKNQIRAKRINDIGAELVGFATRFGEAPYGNKTSLKAFLDMFASADGEVFGARCTMGFDDLDACLKNDTSSFAAGVVIGEAGKTENLDLTDDDDYYEIASDTHIYLPKDYTLNRTRTADAAVDPQAAPIFYASGKNDITIDGGVFEGNASDNDHYTETDHCFHFENCDRVVIRNAYIKNHSGDAIYLKECRDVLIENCIIDNPNVNASGPLIGRYGIYLDDDGGNAMNRLVIQNCTITAHTGIYMAGNAANVDIRGCTIFDCDNDGIYGDGVSDVRIIGNRILTNGGCGILLENQCTDIELHSNLIRDNDEDGLRIDSASGSESDTVTVKSNTFEDNGTTGTPAYGIYLDYVDYIDFCHNRFTDTNTEQAGPGDFNNVDYGLYHGNVCYGHASNALSKTSVANVTESDNVEP